MSFIGNTPTTQSFISGTETFNGTGAQTAYTLTRSVASVNDIQITINNVVQQPNVAYTVLGNVVTFTSAPSAGTGNIYVRYLSTTTQTITPSASTVGLSQLNSDLQSKVGIGFKNRIINGAMVINQRNSTVTVNANANNYSLDRWDTIGTASAGVFTVQQSTDAPTGFKNSLLATVTTASTPAAGNNYALRHSIEGFNVADLGWGTANAQTVTLSFWVKASVTGTYSVGFINADWNRAYPSTYTITSANTWEYKTITVSGDTTGTWATNNTTGVRLWFAIGSGTNTTANTWNVGTAYTATGQTNLIATSGATFYITGVQLEVGTQATTFDYRSIGTELALCQRYFYRWDSSGYVYTPFVTVTYSYPNIAQGVHYFPVSMRAAPTITTSAISTFAISFGVFTLTGFNDFSGINNKLMNVSLNTGTSTIGYSGLITSNGVSNAFINISAEL